MRSGLLALMLMTLSLALIPNRHAQHPVVKKAAADEEKDLSICLKIPTLPQCSTGVTGWLWYYDASRERCIYTGFHGCRGGQKNLFGTKEECYAYCGGVKHQTTREAKEDEARLQ